MQSGSTHVVPREGRKIGNFAQPSALPQFKAAPAQVSDYDPLGRIMNANIAEYHVPVNADVQDIRVIFVDEPDEIINPLGIKGLGGLAVCGGGFRRAWPGEGKGAGQEQPKRRHHQVWLWWTSVGGVGRLAAVLARAVIFALGA